MYFINLLPCRIFKQTVRSAGANLTVKHIHEVSLSVLFLMEAAAKADKMFSVPPRSSSHTTSDVAADVKKMVTHLIERRIITEDSERTAPAFTDPTESGILKLTDKWLKETLDRTTAVGTDSDLHEEEEDLIDFDVEYILADIL